MSDAEEPQFEGRVIGREGFEELRPRMWKNIQDKRRLLQRKCLQSRRLSGKGRKERKIGQIEARSRYVSKAEKRKEVSDWGEEMKRRGKMKTEQMKTEE